MEKLLDGNVPEIAESAFVSEMAYLIGDVVVGRQSSCWPYVCLRGDSGRITIGEETNIQEFSMIHGSTVGDRVTVGHNVTIDHATVGDDVLVGIGSVILGEVTIESECIIAAGCVVPENMTVPAGHMAMGIPAATKPITDAHKDRIQELGEHYVARSQKYLAAGQFD